MTAAFATSLWMIMIIVAVFDAASTESFVAGQTTLGSDNASSLNTLLEGQAVELQEIGPGRFKAPLPKVNVGFLSAVFDFLTFDAAFFKGQFNLIRIPLMALTFTFSLLALKDLGPVLVAIADFLGRTAAGLIGGFGTAIRALLRG